MAPHNRQRDFFTTLEWWIFRLTSIALLSMVAYKLVRAEMVGLFW